MTISVEPISTPFATKQTDVELTILIPCLNESETITRVIDKARASLNELNVSGEIIVADNGSSDGSQWLAKRHGARVIPVATRGYGAALIGGLHAAQGRYVIMGDADDSYDFANIAPFIDALRAGHSLVMGTRMKGTILPGAMPPLHRWIGNPVLTFIGNRLFGTRLSDYHCGLRAFETGAIRDLNLRTTGMEFATEMVAKAAIHELSITEVPITYHPDGRSRRPHLRTWRDGWRHLKFMLLLSPSWVFIQPGMIVLLLGLIGLLHGFTMPSNTTSFSQGLAVHAVSALLVIMGVQMVIFGILARLYANKHGVLRQTPFWQRLADGLSIDTGLWVGGAGILVGGVVLASALAQNSTLWLIVGVLTVMVSIQVIFLSFVVSLIRIQDNFT
jgi:glycosyltransferase involved in cell wall biosynthesis